MGTSEGLRLALLKGFPPPNKAIYKRAFHNPTGLFSECPHQEMGLIFISRESRTKERWYWPHRWLSYSSVTRGDQSRESTGRESRKERSRLDITWAQLVENSHKQAKRSQARRCTFLHYLASSLLSDEGGSRWRWHSLPEQRLRMSRFIFYFQPACSFFIL